MWPFKKRKDRYRFKPKEDIAAYELAIILSPVIYVVVPENGLTKEQFQKVKRHLKLIEDK